MRLIDADALKQEIREGIKHLRNYQGVAICLKALNDAPTIEAEPVRRGKWVKKPFGFECSLCGVNYVWMRNDKECVTGGFAFCPQCGARMDGDE